MRLVPENKGEKSVHFTTQEREYLDHYPESGEEGKKERSEDLTIKE